MKQFWTYMLRMEGKKTKRSFYPRANTGSTHHGMRYADLLALQRQEIYDPI